MPKDTSLPLQDKVAIVTGASSGIGRATAIALAHKGAHLALAARRANLLEEVAGEIQSYGRQALVMPTDIRNPSQVKALVECTIRHFGRVDILVANAGVYVRSPAQEITAEIIENAMQANFYAGVYAILAVLPSMLAQRSGQIVVVTSVDGRKGMPLDAPYASAKFALTGFAEVLRQEVRDKGIYVSTILPGRVDTPMIDGLRVPRVSAKIPAQAVAEAIVKAILKRKPEMFVPSSGRLLVFVNTLSPRLADWFVRRFRLEGQPEEPPQ